MRLSTSLLLVILDGFGISLQKEGNPVLRAHTPTINQLEQWFPHTALQASGVAVGLGWGQAGNSEVGHLTMGAGRVLHHHLPRILTSIHDGSFFNNPGLVRAAEHVRARSSRLHIAGLISSGSVHSYIDHLYALLDFTVQQKIPEVFLHVFTDGKDAPPREGAQFFAKFEDDALKKWPRARIATAIGRSYAMDRGGAWDKIQKAYELATQGKGVTIDSLSRSLARSYQEGIDDSSVEPALLTPEGVIRAGDALIFLNFREDSMREIAHAFTDDAFDKFPRKKISNLFVAAMTEYEKGLAAIPLFPPKEIIHSLAEVIGDAGLSHLHIAETQKYAHVTYFFNGGREEPFPGETRVLIPSASVAHADETPAMRAREITHEILKGMLTHKVIIANFANADMVGHTGNFDAGVQAVEILDESLGHILNAVLAQNAALVITADHGNIERKQNELTGEELTQHSLNPVPFFLVRNDLKRKVPRIPEEIAALKFEVGGVLTDVAPTILELLGIGKPQEMTGESLLGMLEKQIENSAGNPTDTW